MLKKKLEVVELNKKEEKIVLEEKQSRLLIFWKKYRSLIYITALILSLTTLILGIFISVSNLYKSETPIIKKVSVDTTLNDYSSSVMFGDMPLTEDTAKNTFFQNSKFKTDGEVLVDKVVEAKNYEIRFYSDGTALKISKNTNLITRINPLENGEYGINKYGVISIKATYSDVTITKTKEISWGKVTYYSDGSAEITNSKVNMFVRNANDINENYISNNKVSYLKETKKIGNNTLNYYYDGTIEVVKNKKSYIVRNEEDIEIKNNSVTFKNNNEAQINKTLKLADGKIIDYYKDGGAIIREGTKTISVRKSNSIILKDNKIFEIVDNIYVEVSNTVKNGNVIYYTNGGAVVKYKGQTLYVDESSNIKYENNDKTIKKIENDTEILTRETNIEGEKIQVFEKTAVVKTDKYIAIISKDNIIYDGDGTVKELLTNTVEGNKNTFTIQNNTNSLLKYRVVIEESNRTDLDVQYVRYQLQAGEKYIEPTKLQGQLWTEDYLTNEMEISGKNYILLDSEIEAHASEEIKLMLWTDYETIPNSMQNKYFYGTIKVYAWTEE